MTDPSPISTADSGSMAPDPAVEKSRPRTAIVTGGSSGIGLEVGRQLVVAGYEVVLTARRPATLREAADAIGARWTAADSTVPDRFAAVVARGRAGRPRGPRRRRHGRHVRPQGDARDLRGDRPHQPDVGVRGRRRRAAGHGPGRAVRVPVVLVVARTAARTGGLLGVEGGAERLRRRAGQGGRARRHRRARRDHRAGGDADARRRAVPDAHARRRGGGGRRRLARRARRRTWCCPRSRCRRSTAARSPPRSSCPRPPASSDGPSSTDPAGRRRLSPARACRTFRATRGGRRDRHAARNRPACARDRATTSATRHPQVRRPSPTSPRTRRARR